MNQQMRPKRQSVLEILIGFKAEQLAQLVSLINSFENLGLSREHS